MQSGSTYEATSFPLERQVTVQGGRLAARKHTVYALTEVDATQPRRYIREHKKHTGEALSFIAFVIACLGQAVGENKMMHACRDWRNRLILFDQVDVNMMIEIEAEGRKRVMPHWVRAANQRTFRDIHAEIRAAQANPEKTREFGVKWLGFPFSCIWSAGPSLDWS